jgi:nucleoside-diphosphate-sugar epimerase
MLPNKASLTKILIIGGTGTIGYSLISLLSKKKFDVTVISRGNLNRKIKSNIKHIKTNYNIVNLKKIFKKYRFNIVINLILFKKKLAFKDINYFLNKIDHYFFISSASVYNSKTTALSENNIANDKRWEVAKLKLECEKVFLNSYYKKNFPVTIIRPGHIYNYFTIPTNIIGGGNYIIKKMMSGYPAILHGNNYWSLMHAKDFARALIPLLGNKKIIGQILNIGSRNKIKWKKIYETYFKALKIKPSYIFISKNKISKINKNISNSIVGDRSKNVFFNHKKILQYVPKFQEKIQFTNEVKYLIKFFLKNNKKYKIKNNSSLFIDKIYNL